MTDSLLPLKKLEPAKPGARAPLGLVLFAAVGGVVLDRWANVGLSVWLGVSAAAMLAWIGSTVVRRVGGTALVCGIAACVAGAWHHAYWQLYASNHLVHYAAERYQPVCCVARILETPKTMPPRHDPLQPYLDDPCTKMCVKVSTIRGKIASPGDTSTLVHRWVPVSGKALLYVSGIVTDARVGDHIQIFGKLARINDRRNPGGFSSLDRGRSQRTLCRLSASHPESLTVIVRRAAFDPRWWLDGLHESCRAALFRYLDEDAAPLAAAVLLGDREYLEVSQIDSFFVTGTVHLLAISGLHLAIVVNALFVVARLARLPRRSSLWFVMSATLLYAALTGARPPVVRAAVLVCMLCAELLYFKPRFSFNSLAAAGLVILALNPTNVFQPGVQLSFLAVATLIWISRFDRARELSGLKRCEQFEIDNATLLPYLLGKLRRRAAQTVLAGLAIWLISIPLVMHRFHLVPMSGLVLNLFLLVPLAVALYFGLLVIAFAWLPPLATVCGWGASCS